MLAAEVPDDVRKILGSIDAEGENLSEVLDCRFPSLWLEFVNLWDGSRGCWIQTAPLSVPPDGSMIPRSVRPIWIAIS